MLSKRVYIEGEFFSIEANTILEVKKDTLLIIERDIELDSYLVERILELLSKYNLRELAYIIIEKNIESNLLALFNGYYNGKRYRNTIRINSKETKDIFTSLAHELGHYIVFLSRREDYYYKKFKAIRTKERASLLTKLINTFNQDKRILEDIAISFSLYHTRREEFRNLLPLRFKAIEELEKEALIERN